MGQDFGCFCKTVFDTYLLSFLLSNTYCSRRHANLCLKRILQEKYLMDMWTTKTQIRQRSYKLKEVVLVVIKTIWTFRSPQLYLHIKMLPLIIFSLCTCRKFLFSWSRGEEKLQGSRKQKAKKDKRKRENSDGPQTTDNPKVGKMRSKPLKCLL